MSVIYAAPANFDINKLTEEVNKATGARNINNITDLFNNAGKYMGITTLAFFVAGGLVLLYLIYGGIMLMTSSGDPKKVAGAQETIKNAIVGMIVVILSYWIVQVVGFVLGLPAFQQTF